MFFKTSRPRRPLVWGPEKDGLCYVAVARTSSVTSHALSATVSPIPRYFWLGHPSMAKLMLANPGLNHEVQRFSGWEKTS